MRFWATRSWLPLVAGGLLTAGRSAGAQVATQGNDQGKPTIASEARPKSQPLPDAKVPLLSGLGQSGVTLKPNANGLY